MRFHADIQKGEILLSVTLGTTFRVTLVGTYSWGFPQCIQAGSASMRPIRTRSNPSAS